MKPAVSAIADEYVAARRVLLDALDALGPHRGAVIVSGAQAIYLRTGGNRLPIADFTTDGDIALDPNLLAKTPKLAELMKGAGSSKLDATTPLNRALGRK